MHFNAPFAPSSFFTTCFPAVGNFTLIPQHTSPNSAVEEIDALYDVVADVLHRWKTNVIILTTLNKRPKHTMQPNRGTSPTGHPADGRLQRGL